MSNNYPVKSSKFFKLYDSLNDKEKAEFGEFSRLKFISGNRNYEKVVNREEADVKSRTYWNRLSELTKIIEDYLLLKKVRENKEERNTQLLELYNERKINAVIEQQFNFVLKEIEKQKFSTHTFFNLHRIHLAFSANQIQNNRYLKFVKHYRKQSEYMLAYLLDNLYTSQTEFSQQKLENIWHDWLANETVLNALDSTVIIDEFRENLPGLDKHIKYSFYLYKAFDDPDKTEYFFEAKKLFDQLLPSLSHEYAVMAYQAFINYCINRTNNYDASFNRVLFDIYNEKLSQGFDEDIRFRNYPTNNFRDYVIVGLRLNEFDWVDNFITQYGKILPDDYKPDEENITRAMIYFNRNEYDKALRLLENTKRKNYLHYIDVSDIKLRIYYETGEMVKAYEENTRLEKYLHTSEAIPKQRKASYDIFRKIFKRLLKLKEDFTEERLAKIELYIKKQPNFFRRAWIEEKLKEIAK